MDGVELIVRNYGMSISKTRPEVVRFQIRVVREDGLRSFPLSKQTENKFDGDAHAPNDGFTAKNLRVHCYASKKSLVDHGCWCFRYSEHFVRQDIVDSKRLVGHAYRGTANSIASNNRFSSASFG